MYIVILANTADLVWSTQSYNLKRTLLKGDNHGRILSFIDLFRAYHNKGQALKFTLYSLLRDIAMYGGKQW